MSELVNNQTIRRVKRQEALKRVILDLHEGKTVKDVKGEFAALLSDVGGGEIAELEQALIADGLPEDDIKRLCDVHVAVFEDALESQPEPEALPGHPVDTLRAENDAVERVLQALEQAVAGADWDQAQAHLAHLRLYEKHYVRKENILFPYLEKHGFSGPSSVMWAIHDDVRTEWKALEGMLAAGPGGDGAAFREQVEATLASLSTTIRDMAYKEESILVPAALERLTDQEWQAVRAQEPEIGYFEVQPGDGAAIPGPEEKSPAMPTSTAEPASAGGELRQLDTGALSTEEINMLLTHLPVDVTYVDADDAVRYFSAGQHRIFPRSPAIIGRRVQKCHPPASMHRVQEILDSFRAGVRDEAEFWIQLGDRFIHIRYFALRGPGGAYRGTLEVSQDVTAIRGLEGEKRLIEGANGD